jgi:putative flippase GtrA
MITKQDRRKLVRFGVSGLMATGLHVSVAVVLIKNAHMSSTLANTMAFMFATSGSYLLQTLWSFSSSISLRNVGRFMMVSLGGLALTGGVSHAAQTAGASPWLGIAMVICIVPSFTYVAHRCWTYR